MSEGTDSATTCLHVKGDVIEIMERSCSAAQSHHISLQTKRSSGIHFRSSDSLSCSNLIFVCQLQAKWSPCPSVHSGIAIQQSKRTYTNYNTLLQHGTICQWPPKKHNPVVGGLHVRWFDKSWWSTDWDRECEERNDEQGDRCCTVIFIGRRYEMLFWAIKEKPQGCWCGDEGAENTSRKTRCPGRRECEDVFFFFFRWKVGDRLCEELQSACTYTN